MTHGARSIRLHTLEGVDWAAPLTLRSALDKSTVQMTVERPQLKNLESKIHQLCASDMFGDIEMAI